MRRGEDIPWVFNLVVEHAGSGLWIIASREIHGLLVARSTLEDALAEVPAAIDAMKRALETQ